MLSWSVVFYAFATGLMTDYLFSVFPNPPADSHVMNILSHTASVSQPDTEFTPEIIPDTPDISNLSNTPDISNLSDTPEQLSEIDPININIEPPWNLILISELNPLPEDYPEPELSYLPSGHAVDSRVYPDLSRMLSDARAAGLQPIVCSSYRSHDRQVKLFSNKMQSYLNQDWSWEDADYHAALWIARPGASEHEAGLAVDIVDKRYQLLDDAQADTPAQQWLMAHCAEYGFILRYPADKTDHTGVSYEPWHYRYVGVDAARDMTENNLCLEEYVWRLSHESA